MKNILIADDETIFLDILRHELSDAGFHVMVARDGQEACTLLETYQFHIVLLDVQMPHKSGFELIRTAQGTSKDCIIILMTAYASIDNAVKAIKLGAQDYISKPFDIGELLDKISQLMDSVPIKLPNLLENTDLFGSSLLMQQLKKNILKIKDLNITVLITGESGTGKSLIAREIHSQGNRAKLPFIHVDCASLPTALVESELFGHEKGAFTGAVTMKKGKFEAAGEGIVFLDEIGALPLSLQSKLLIALQERCFYRLGGTQKIPLKARILAATNKNLEKSIQEETFREDLYYRLNVVRMQVPPLRLRKEDIPCLSHIFISRFSEAMGKPVLRIDEGFLEILKTYSWPGNIRELENALESAIALCDENHLKITDLPLKVTNHKDTLSPAALPDSMKTFVKQQERITIMQALEKCQGHREKTAKLLGISRRTLQYKLKDYRLLDFK